MSVEVKVSFQSKERIRCPLCGAEFRREELLSGSGRLIAGALTEELHRLYEPSAKYGDLYPLAYQATVCPECWYAAMDKDFLLLPPSCHGRAQKDEKQRLHDIKLIFPEVDFTELRDLVSGAASQALALRCYDYFPKEFSPCIKQGLAALRAGWLLEELDRKKPGEHYDWLTTLFKKKAHFFYTEALRREQNGEESLSGIKYFGPDTDKNYGYEGVLYLSALLKLRYGPATDPGQRAASLAEAKRTIAKIFGLGKASKNKPSPLLEHARNLYANLNKELNETDD
jgi:uncharacterized protein (DUF2225 family)